VEQVIDGHLHLFELGLKVDCYQPFEVIVEKEDKLVLCFTFGNFSIVLQDEFEVLDETLYFLLL
jgi:hypothetical protein